MNKKIFLFFLISLKSEINFNTKNLNFDSSIIVNKNFYQMGVASIDTGYFKNIITIDSNINNENLTVGNISEKTVIFLYGLSSENLPLFLLFIDPITGLVYKKTNKTTKAIMDTQIEWDNICTNNINSINNILKIQNKNTKTEDISLNFISDTIYIKGKNIFLNNLLSQTGVVSLEKSLLTNALATCSELVSVNECISDTVNINTDVTIHAKNSFTNHTCYSTHCSIWTKELLLKSIATNNLYLNNLPTAKNEIYRICINANENPSKTKENIGTQFNFLFGEASTINCQNLNLKSNDRSKSNMQNLIIDSLNCEDTVTSNIIIDSNTIITSQALTLIDSFSTSSDVDNPFTTLIKYLDIINITNYRNSLNITSKAVVGKSLKAKNLPILPNFTHFILIADYDPLTLESNIAALEKTSVKYKNKKKFDSRNKKANTTNRCILLIETIQNIYKKIQKEKKIYVSKKEKYDKINQKYKILKERVLTEIINLKKTASTLTEKQIKILLQELNSINFGE
jgi:hypothetical protein